MNEKKITFSAIPSISINISNPSEVEVKGKDYISWGDDNQFPTYLLDLLKASTIFGSIIQGETDYVLGDGVEFSGLISDFAKRANNEGENLEDIIRKAVLDYCVFDGFALQVFRNEQGKITGIYNIDLANIRLSKDEKFVYYSPNWGNSRQKPIKYPKFSFDEYYDNSIYYYKGKNARVDNVYPSPSYIAALNDIRTSAEISNFHLTSVLNNFNASAILNFNSGEPDDETKKRIETLLKEKFCGTSNGSKLLVNWNDNKDSAISIERLQSDDFAERYDTLSKSITKNIFTSFRATPNLFGLVTENDGFNNQEYESAFKLYNRTVILQLQKQIERCFNSILGDEAIKIKAFTINLGGE